MANRFWVGGGASTNWNATSNTNWATTSGGSNNASVPGTGDVAIFDSNSGTGNSVVSASITVQGLDCTGGTGSYTGTITHNNGVTLTINTAAASSFRLSSGMTYTPLSGQTALITFSNTSGTAQLTSAGKALPSITINGVGGTVQQQDAININGYANATFTLTNGTWDCNSNAMTANLFNASSGNTCGLLLGGTVTVGGNITASGTVWNLSTTGLTFTKNSANIVILSPTATGIYQTFTSGGATYNGITINASTNGPVTLFSPSAAMTWSSLTIGSGNLVTFPGNHTITISGSGGFTVNGTSAAGTMIISSSFTSEVQATISCSAGACSAAYASIGNITGTGGATFNATNSFSFGATTGWTIAGPPTFTAAAIATAVWEDTFSGGDFATAGSAGLLLSNMQNLGYTVPAIGRGTVGSSSSTTSVTTSAFTPSPSASVANQLVGRVVLFDATTTTVALRGQATVISASSASSTPTLTVGTLTATPASGDTFSVL